LSPSSDRGGEKKGLNDFKVKGNLRSDQSVRAGRNCVLNLRESKRGEALASLLEEEGGTKDEDLNEKKA